MLTTECSKRRKPSCRDKGWGRVDEGPCACPPPGERIQRVSRNPWRTRHSPGQAQGPHPSPHPPLVPTKRRGRKRPDGRDDPLRLEKFIRGLSEAERSAYHYFAPIADLSAWGAHRRAIGR